MTEVMQWSGVERRDGSDRRHQELPWQDERRQTERRRGGIGVHHPDPTESLLRGIQAPEMLAFEPRAASRGSTDPAGGGGLLHTLAPEHGTHDAIPSAAAIAGHPLHPMVVPLPIGAFTGAVAADVAYAATRDPFFARAGRLLTLAGLVTGALAAILGGVSIALRSRDGQRATVPAGIALSALSAMVLVVTGWLGGELSYR